MWREIALAAGVLVVVAAAGVPLWAAEGSGTASGSETKGADVPEEFMGMPLVFSEDFENGCARWTPTDAKAWRIDESDGNHVYALHKSSDYKPPVRSPHSISLVSDLVVGDFVLEAKMKQTGKEYGHRDLCIFFGHSGPGHFYYVHIATKADAHANSVFLVNDEPRVSVAKERTDGTDWGRGWHQVRLVRRTGTGLIQVFYDDMEKPIMVAEDKTFLSGKVGFGSFDDVGQIDDVRVWGKKEEK